MKRLAERTQDALRLQPMTIRQVARCLSVSDRCMQECLCTLERRHIVRRNGWNGKAHLFELTPLQHYGVAA